MGKKIKPETLGRGIKKQQVKLSSPAHLLELGICLVIEVLLSLAIIAADWEIHKCVGYSFSWRKCTPT